VVGRSVVGEAA